MLNVVFIIVVSLVGALAVALILGSRRWNSGTQKLRAQMNAAQVPVQPLKVDYSELENLPEPVQRFFRTALPEGQPMVTEVGVRHEGTFNMGETADQWKPFTSDQKVITHRPGFDWDARIAMAPGLSVRVHDAYIAGKGLLQASLLGLLSLVDAHGTEAVDEGELMRFLAEAAWYPSALLPSQGVRWEAVDATSARAALTDGDTSVTLLFTFNDSGLIETVRAEARGRMVGGAVIPTPWQGRFWNYQKCNGIQVPFEGEVAWLLPAGEKPYWRGRITEIHYGFAQ